MQRCESPRRDQEVAARFFETTTRPEIAKRADMSREQQRFGSPEYIRHMLGLTPKVRDSWRADGAAMRQRYLGAPAELTSKATAFGSQEAIAPQRAYAAVELQLRDAGTPADGDMVLVHFVDVETCRVVFVMRVLSG